MRTTRQMSVTLPHEMADMVRAKVTSGEYASESEVIRDGLRALAARDRAVEMWLRDQAVAAYDRLQLDPDSALTAEAVRARLDAMRTQ
ncbi:MAG: type II toxin-antitoxin system ParD family antitoxin [Dermatophilaceae bacterium]